MSSDAINFTLRLQSVLNNLNLSMLRARRCIRKSTIAMVLLVAALLGSNYWWLNHYIAQQTEIEFANSSIYESQRALAQALVLANQLAVDPATSKEALLNSIDVASAKLGVFRIDDIFWIGSIGLKFDSDDKLTEVVTEPDSKGKAGFPVGDHVRTLNPSGSMHCESEDSWTHCSRVPDKPIRRWHAVKNS